MVVACDVETLFVDAAEAFAPQKGATPAQVALLRRPLERLAQIYLRDYAVDVRHQPGSGAEGTLDAESFESKAVGGVIDLASPPACRCSWWRAMCWPGSYPSCRPRSRSSPSLPVSAASGQ